MTSLILNSLHCLWRCLIPVAELSTILPAPLASAVLWREVWSPWARGSLVGIWNQQITAWPLLSSRLKVGITLVSSLWLLWCHLSAENRLKLTCQDLIIHHVPFLCPLQLSLWLSSLCHYHCCSSSHRHSEVGVMVRVSSALQKALRLFSVRSL